MVQDLKYGTDRPLPAGTKHTPPPRPLTASLRLAIYPLSLDTLLVATSASDWQFALLQFLHNDLPAPDHLLLINGRNPPRIDLDIGELCKSTFCLNHLGELLWRGWLDEDLE